MCPVGALEPEIVEYYQRGREAGRLAGEFSSGPLELARTQKLMGDQGPMARPRCTGRGSKLRLG